MLQVGEGVERRVSRILGAAGSEAKLDEPCWGFCLVDQALNKRYVCFNAGAVAASLTVCATIALSTIFHANIAHGLILLKWSLQVEQFRVQRTYRHRRRQDDSMV